MGFNLLGDGLRDVLDPRIRRAAGATGHRPSLPMSELLSVQRAVGGVRHGPRRGAGARPDQPRHRAWRGGRAGGRERVRQDHARARPILGVLPAGGRDPRAARFTGRAATCFSASRRLVNDEIRGRAITFIPQDPWSSLSPLFTVGAQIMDLMKWKSPRRAGAGARSGRWPALAPRLSARAAPRGPRAPCWTCCAPCRFPSRSARSGGCPTSSRVASASG